MTSRKGGFEAFRPGTERRMFLFEKGRTKEDLLKRRGRKRNPVSQAAPKNANIVRKGPLQKCREEGRIIEKKTHRV